MCDSTDPTPDPVFVQWSPADFERLLDAAERRGDEKGYQRAIAALRRMDRAGRTWPRQSADFLEDQERKAATGSEGPET